MLGDIDAPQPRAWLEKLHLEKEKPFAASYVENARTGFEPIVCDERFCARFPPSGKVIVAAVAVAPIAVPIILLVFLRLEHAMDFVVHHPRQVIALGALMQRGNEIL